MTNEKQILCPFCRSDNVLPYEEDHPDQPHTMLVIFLSAFLILGFYFLFLLLSTLSYPIMVIILITIFSLYFNRKEKKKNKIKRLLKKDFMCVDCGQSFTRQIPGN